MFSSLFAPGAAAGGRGPRPHATARQAALAKLAAVEREARDGGDVFAAVAVPPGVDAVEWVASATVDAYNAAALVYGLVSSGACTEASCPVMTASARFEYLFLGPEPGARPTRVSAPVYVGRLLDATEAELAAFPSAEGAAFPDGFVAKRVAPLWRRLSRVWGHVLHAHFAEVEALGGEAHVTSSLRWFVAFALTHGLVAVGEFAPLAEVADALTGSRWGITAATGGSGAVAAAPPPGGGGAPGEAATTTAPAAPPGGGAHAAAPGAPSTSAHRGGAPPAGR